MIEHESIFNDDVKLALVYSMLTRSMLKILQRSPIGKTQFKTLTDASFAWFTQMRQKEKMFTDSIPAIQEFITEHNLLKEELNSELLNSVAEVSLYIITHAQDKQLHETISLLTNPSYGKCLLKKAWEAGEQHPRFEDWYTDNFK